MLPIFALVLACRPPASLPEADPDSGVVISAFMVRGVDEVRHLDQCVRVANAGSTPVDLADHSLSAVLGPGASGATAPRDRRKDLVFPTGLDATRLDPGDEITIARDAETYLALFGERPDFEVGKPNDDPDVPNLDGGPGAWVLPVDEGGVITLFAPPDAAGNTRALDVVVWDFLKNEPIPALMGGIKRYADRYNLSVRDLWAGAPIDTYGNIASPYSSKTRVYLRDRATDGSILPDTNTWEDWNSGSSLQSLGRDPTHRIEMAGQSHFVSTPRVEDAILTMTSSPDNNFQGTLDLWSRAKHEILVSVYYFKSTLMMDALVDAIERGVDVTVYLEGGNVGVANGFTDTERYIAQQIEEAGRERSGDESHGLGRVYWLASISDQGIPDRYKFDHSKYSIVDRRNIIIGSENYGTTGHTSDPRYGNRGWEIQIQTPDGDEPLAVVQDLIAVWEDDVDEAHPDIIRYTDDESTLDRYGRGRYGPPPRGFYLEEHPHAGHYVPAFPAPVTVEEEDVRMELVLSPDTSLNEETAILGAIAGAEHELLLQHLDMRWHWGSGRITTVESNDKTTPSLLLQAILEAARRGVRVRVLLDCSGFDCDCVPDWRDRNLDNNDDTVAYLRRVAAEEGLDLQARLIDNKGPDDEEGEDREHQGLAKIHNKGVLVDGQRTLFSSINGSENSFKGNREVAVLVDSRKVADYYRTLFYYDWTTILAPQRVEQIDEPHGREDSVSFTLTGLEPSTQYYVRVSSFDTDDTDVDCVNHDYHLGPHESAFSNEIRVHSDRRGVVHLEWDPNTSEADEGDLGGYLVYFGTEGRWWAPTSWEAHGAYEGTSDQGDSPVTVEVH